MLYGLRDYRLSLDKTQIEFAELLGIKSNTYAKLELGYNRLTPEFIQLCEEKLQLSSEQVYAIFLKRNNERQSAPQEASHA